ncbi:MAG: TolC family protein [Candidatus Gastranaerophilales bacterium]|nr:TolC family protein [Candidatus Gastranaerophilales bacterium]
MLKKIATFVIIYLSLCTTGYAIEDAKKINLDEAVKITLENNLDLKAAKINISIAKNNIKMANRLQNPDVNLFYNLGKAGAGNPQQIGLSETIEIAKRSARKNLAKSNFELEKEKVEFTSFDLKMAVREAYVNLMSAKSVLTALKEQQKLLEDLKNIAKKRVEAGAAPEIDLLQAQIALNQMTTQVNTAQVNVKTAAMEFNKIINAKNENAIVYDSNDGNLWEQKTFAMLLTPNPAENLPLFDNIVKDTLKNRFDLKIAKNEIDVAKKNLILIGRQRIPDLALIGGYAYQPDSMSDDGTFKTGAYAGASLVNLPLLYSYRPEIKNAKLQLEQADLKYTSVENKAVKDLKSSYEKFVTAKMNLNYYNDNLLKNSEELVKISKRSYEVGKSNLTSLIVMEQSYKSIILGYNYALAEYYNCWIDFLRDVNTEEFDFNEKKV